MCTGVQGWTGTVVAPINVDARSSILAWAQLMTFIYIICAVLPSPTTVTCATISFVSVVTDSIYTRITCGTFIHIICAVLPSPTTNTDTAVSVGSVHTVTIILTWHINGTIVNGSTVWTSVDMATHAGIAIPRVNAGTSVHTRLGGTEINVFTAGGASPPRGAVAGERFNLNNHNIRALPTI